MTVRTRFAPSPTGSLHIGGARTALYNYLLAKKLGGQFILRIEDTDKARNSEASLRQLVEELNWLGLHWDEGVDAETLRPFGKFGPYQQSQRQAIYDQYIQQLLESGQAFYCFADEATIDQHREQYANNPQVHFQSPDKTQSLADARTRLANGESAVIRYHNTHTDAIFTIQDLVRGEVNFPGHMIGDFIIQRADGSPVYNFCCAIDDCNMQITHVLRGEEHLPNTLRQVMIIDALGLKRPEYGHLSLILGEGNKKLSKRDGAASVSEYQQAGYIPEGLNNYLALLGWSDPEHREILSLDDMASAFSTDRLHAAAPHFDAQKCRWVNHQQLQRYNAKQLHAACTPFLSAANLLPKQGPEWTESVLPQFQLDLHVLADCCPIFAKLCDHAALLTPAAHDVLQWPHVSQLLEQWLDALLDTLPEGEINLDAPNLHSGYLKSYPENKANFREMIQYIKGQIASDPHASKLLPSTLYQIIDSIILASSGQLRKVLIDIIDAEVYIGITKQLQQAFQIKGKQLFMPLRVAIIGNNEGMDLKLACRLIPVGSLIKRALYAILSQSNKA